LITKTIDFLTSTQFTYDPTLFDFSSGDLRLLAPIQIDNPIVIYNIKLYSKQMISFIEDSAKTGSDEIKYIINKNGKDYYYNVNYWLESDGTYLKSNTASEINMNISKLISASSDTQEIILKIFLHSETGATTPILTSLFITYDYQGETEQSVDTVTVWGYLKDISNQKVTSNSLRVVLNTATLEELDFHIDKTEYTITSDNRGVFKIDLIKTEPLDTATHIAYYSFVFGNKTVNKIIETTKIGTYNFNTLTDYV